MTESRLPLLFAHANGFNGGSYRRFLDPFSDRHDVHAIDVLGLDPRYPVTPGWEDLSREVEAHLERLPAPAVLMGHSLGGVLSFLVAQRRPERVRALVMLDPPLINGLDAVGLNLLRAIGQTERAIPPLASARRRAEWPDWQAVQDYFSRRAFFQALDPECLQDYLRHGLLGSDEQGWRLRCPPAIEAEIFRTTPTHLRRMPRLAVPGAVVSGRSTQPRFLVCHRRHVRRHRMLHRVLEGSHMFPLERPRESARAVQGLLQELLERSRD